MVEATALLSTEECSENECGRDLSIMVRASPSGVPHLSSTPQPAGVQLDQAGTSAE